MVRFIIKRINGSNDKENTLINQTNNPRHSNHEKAHMNPFKQITTFGSTYFTFYDCLVVSC